MAVEMTRHNCVDLGLSIFGFSHWGAHRLLIVPAEPVDFSCGTDYQTRAQILQECPRYQKWRHLLQDVSPQISIPEILGIREGIAVLSAFIQKSGAFSKTGELRAPPTTPLLEDEPDVEKDDLIPDEDDN